MRGDASAVIRLSASSVPKTGSSACLTVRSACYERGSTGQGRLICHQKECVQRERILENQEREVIPGRDEVLEKYLAPVEAGGRSDDTRLAPVHQHDHDLLRQDVDGMTAQCAKTMYHCRKCFYW